MKFLDVETKLSDLNIQCIHVLAEESECGTSIDRGFLDQELKVAGPVVLLRVGCSDLVQIGVGEELDSCLQVNRLIKASIHLIGVLRIPGLRVAVHQRMCSNLVHGDETWLVQQVPSDGNVVLVHPNRNGDNNRPVGGDHMATHFLNGK